MNAPQESRSRAADEQAALWAARLDGDNLDRAQRNELDAWLAENPAHRTLLSGYCQFSADLEEQVPALVAAGSVTLPAAAEPREGVRRKWTFPRLAGVTLAAAALVVSISVLRPTPNIQNIAMAPAERGSRTLADGTRLEVSANTSLRFENKPTERHVLLAGGEVLFAVAKDAARPFIITTPAGLVRVTGTTFNVRTDAASHTFEVTVVEGSVEVSPGELKGVPAAAPVKLGTGDQFSTRVVGGLRQLSPSQIDDTLAWRNGKIVFEDAPLSEVAARFAQYHGCAIHVAPSVADQRLGGLFGLDDLRSFLASLELALPRVKVQTELSGAVTMTLRPGS